MASRTQATYRNTALSNTVVLVNTKLTSLVGWNLINTGASNYFIKTYNAAAATDVTLGSTTPVKTLMVPAGGLFFLSNEDKYQDDYSLGLCIVATGAIADSDTSAPGTAVYCELKYYQELYTNSNLSR